jgi:hypothetical protein
MAGRLTRAIEESKKRAAWAVELASRSVALTAPGQSPQTFIPHSGQATGLSMLNARDDTTLAAEQGRHFTGWVYSSVRPIAYRIAGQPLRIARLKKKEVGRKPERSGIPYERRAFMPKNFKAFEAAYDAEVLDDHELLDAINDPNAIMTRWALLYVTTVALNVVGRAYWWIRKRQQEEGEPVGPELEIWPIPASWIQPVHEKGKLFSSWTIRPDDSSEDVPVPGDEILYFYYPDFTNPMGSYSPMQAQTHAVAADEAMARAQTQGFRNGVNPSAIITVGRHAEIPGMSGTQPRLTLTANQRAAIIHLIKAHYRGVSKHDEPLILDSLIEDVKPYSRSPKEMDFMDSGKVAKERITQGFGTNPVVMGQLEGANRACHDDQTELLTDRGWLKYADIKVGDVAGTMNPATGRFEWQCVTHVHIYPDYNGEMVRLTGQKIDALVTPNHRMWSRRGQRAGKLTPDSPYGFKAASDLRCSDVLPLSPLPQAAERVNFFRLPGVRDGAGVRSNGPTFDATVPMDPFMEFLGWFVSEGWTVSHRRRDNNAPCHSVGVKQIISAVEECRRIHACMAALNLRKIQTSFTRAYAGHESADGYARQETVTYRITDKRLWSWLRENCGRKSSEKRLPDFLFRMSGEQAVRTLEAMLLGDGSHRVSTPEKTYTSLHASYFSTSRELMDQTQTLSLICGRAARMRKTMSSGVHAMGVSEYSREMSLLPKHISREHYQGTVWCVTVPNGLIVTRRNGKTLVSGNSAIAADGHFCDSCVNPMAALISEVMTAWLGPRYAKKNERLVIYIEPATAIDQDFELKAAIALAQQGAVDINWLRHKFFGLRPIAGGNVAFVSKNLVPYEIKGVDEVTDGTNPFIERADGVAAASKPEPKPEEPPENPPAQDPPEEPVAGGEES